MTVLATLLLVLAVQDPAPAPPPGEEVRKGDLVPAYEFDAVIDAAERFELKLQFETYSGELLLRSAAAHGARLRKGEPLLAVEPAALKRQIAVQENDLRLARAQLEKAEAERELGARNDELALAQAERAVGEAEIELKTFQEVDGRQLLANAELAVRQNQDVVDDQKEELEQLEKMYKSEELTSATAEIVVRRARRGLERSRVFLEMARADAGVVRTVRHPQQTQRRKDAVDGAHAARASLKAAQAFSKVQREVEFAKARDAAEAAQEALGRLGRDLERLRVTAPFDGLVFHGQFQQGAWATVDQVAPFLRPGEHPPVGQVLLTLCGPAALVLADVPEAEVADIVPGLVFEIRPVAAPEQSSAGTVASLSPHSAPRGTGSAFQARIPLAAPRADLLPGMRAKASLKGAALKDVVLVPSKALSHADGKSTVEVVKDGKTETREVRAGRSDGKLTHVRSGLEPGERVAVPK